MLLSASECEPERIRSWIPGISGLPTDEESGRYLSLQGHAGKDLLHEAGAENRIGEGGRVMETQTEYAQYVNRLLFGFETMDEYREMMDLLIQLRTRSFRRILSLP